jgi:nucleotide-binding universal stress UspA family protein
MKILLATDGSPSAKHAEALAAATTWPAGTVIEVLRVDQFIDDEIDLRPQRFAAAYAARRHEIDDRLAALVEELSGPGRTVHARVIFGRPATAIVSEAGQLGSELVLIGSHNHGAFASFTLGSVAAEVVDHAPCPVLVARSSSLGPIVLGHDGSEGAKHAEELVATWPFLAHETVRVVSVSPLLPPWYMTADAGMSSGITDEFLQEVLDERRARSARVANAATARLVERGLTASAEVRAGASADGLLDAIAAAKAQLIVVGSRGNTGLARLLLGSVARTVLYQAPCSVLIVRQSVGAPPVEKPPTAAIAV